MMKIKKIHEIKEIADKIRKHKTIVTTNGAFDILHIGHLKSLREAKKLGDILIVCLNSDKSVKGYKSKDRPINSQKDRAEILAEFECVDYVVIFNEQAPCKILEIIKPHRHVKSKSGFKGIETEVVESNGGKIILMDDVKGYSTTNILKKLR